MNSNELSQSENIYSGEIIRLAFGGQGIALQEQMVVFIPFTAIGDHITYRIVQRKKTYAIGQLVEIINISAQRTNPLCPYFGTCGGCQLQHLAYSAQLEYKRQSIEDALNKQAHINLTIPPVIPAQHQWAYRRRINLTLKPLGSHFICGYTAVDNASLINVTQCPIFIPASEPIIHQVQEVIRTLIPQGKEQGRVSILKQEGNQYLLHFHFKNMPRNIEDILRSASKRYHSWTGIMATSPDRSWKHGQMETRLDIEGLQFVFSPRAFIQNHPEQSLNIYSSLCKHVLSSNRENVLDLYCGIGISSMLFASKGLKVTGVEANKEAVKFARENAQKNCIASVNFIHDRVENVLENAFEKASFETVIVNPPREGLDQNVIKTLLKHTPESIVYVSCMPSTLARDLKPLCESKYRVVAVEAYDMFPQTAHVETLVVLQKNNLT